ncbi:hypothetical protein NE236_27645 [Actinoallomurus purpureus]|uniref:hypothetical protein n=1 Tax=Actinoallomurus purpureus TaxID=478114 RepID=UPI0020924176|nr:hypothetical protein [Actinoallomurus purpureus]MCO6008754.1 hypothetical protein [Actinoallomurus purpureus]
MSADARGILRRRFPGMVIWYGPYTGSWWALVPPPVGWRLVEALDPEELTRAIVNAVSWPWPPSPRFGIHGRAVQKAR